MATVPFGPARADIKGVRAGDLNEMQVTLTAGGNAFDLTGRTVTAQARQKATSASALDAVVTVLGDPLDGIVTVRWPGDDVRSLLAGRRVWKGVWDLQVGDGVADPTTVIAGSFQAEMDVTR
jgi:hypothetical protein